jgi:hypothetical protein
MFSPPFRRRAGFGFTARGQPGDARRAGARVQIDLLLRLAT